MKRELSASYPILGEGVLKQLELVGGYERRRLERNIPFTHGVSAPRDFPVEGDYKIYVKMVVEHIRRNSPNLLETFDQDLITLGLEVVQRKETLVGYGSGKENN